MGNRTRAETITAGATQLTNYTYNSANQLMSDGTQLFSYDANGRLTSAGDRSYSYALNDRLITLSQPGLSATFAYNGDGVRLAQTENGSETRYLVDTQRGYSEVVGAITPESETWYLLGLDVLGQQQGSDWSYYAYDGLGSVRLALDSSGSPSAGMRYEPYGLPAASWGTPPALGFTGEWTDSSGLLYLRARYLDPSSATFLSRDPFEGLPTRALSRNGYSWVEGNPINYVDPSGEIPLLAAAASVAFGAVMGAISAYSSAAALYDLAYGGHCGCDAQDWARSTSRDQFLIQMAAFGAIGGALGGVGIASGSGQLIRGISATLATHNLGKAVGEMAAYGADLCRLLNTLLAVLGIWSPRINIPPSNSGALAFNTGGSVAVAGAAAGSVSVAGQGLIIGSGLASNVLMATEGEPELQPYGGPGRGHHIHAKAAFRGNPNYDENEAPALPKEAMEEGQHGLMTSNQNTLFRELGRDVANNVRQNTLAEHSRIAMRVLVDAGFTREQASRWVAQSERWLQSQGITKPECIPWVNCSGR